MKYIVVEGNPVQGFQYFGPFDSTEEADDFAADQDSDEVWTVRLLSESGEGISMQERGLAKLHLD